MAALPDNAARPVLCGGCPVMGMPTAISLIRQIGRPGESRNPLLSARAVAGMGPGFCRDGGFYGAERGIGRKWDQITVSRLCPQPSRQPRAVFFLQAASVMCRRK